MELLSDLLLVKASEVNLLDVSHVEDILEEGQMTEHILVWHLDREGSLCPDTFHWKYSLTTLFFVHFCCLSPVFLMSTLPMSSNFLIAMSRVQNVPVLPIPALQCTTMGGPRVWPDQAGDIEVTSSACFSLTHWHVKSIIHWYSLCISHSTHFVLTVMKCLIIDHLQKLEHAECTVRCAVVRPRCELKMTDISEKRSSFTSADI